MNLNFEISQEKYYFYVWNAASITAPMKNALLPKSEIFWSNSTFFNLAEIRETQTQSRLKNCHIRISKIPCLRYGTSQKSGYDKICENEP